MTSPAARVRAAKHAREVRQWQEIAEMTRRRLCGPCSTRQHDRCIPDIPSDRTWHCECPCREERQ